MRTLRRVLDPRHLIFVNFPIFIPIPSATVRLTVTATHPALGVLAVVCRASCVFRWAVTSGPGGVPFLSVCLSVCLSLFFFVVSLLTSVTSVGVLGPCRKSTSPSTAPNESAAFPRICIVYRAISQRRIESRTRTQTFDCIIFVT